jgi:competence protein ComEA
VKKLLTALCILLSTAGPVAAAVDANTASADALRGVSGIGPAIAKRIVEERRHGPYRSLDDLQARVKGVGESSVRRFAAGGLVVADGASSSARAAPTVETRGEPKASGRR